MTTGRAVPGAAADPERLTWWRAFDAAHARTEVHLRRALLDQHDLALAWYRVLDVLAQQSAPQVLGAVAAALGVPLSSLSRQVDRLEERALVSTERGSHTNHRHVVVHVTADGKALWKQATTTVRQTLRRHVLTDIDPTELVDDARRATRVAPYA
jgi:DNA-binding MarR family transcriptional regulator